MSVQDKRDPMSRPRPVKSFLGFVREDPPKGLRIAYSRNLGITPVDPIVNSVFSDLIRKLESISAEIEETHPDLRNAPGAFQVLRAAALAADMGQLLEDHEKNLKPELVNNIRQGMECSADEIGRAEVEQGRIYREMHIFFENYDLLIKPTTIVPPFDKECRYPKEVNGHNLKTYFEWFSITYAISLTACPAISVLAGFTEDGLPIGLQIIASPYLDANLLSAAARIEDLLGFHVKLPINPITR